MRIPWESKALRWRAETAGRAPVEGMKKTLAGKLALTAFIVGGSELGLFVEVAGDCGKPCQEICVSLEGNGGVVARWTGVSCCKNCCNV